MSNNLYTQRRFLLMTLDPVHIGTGGYRLGRVELSIVREPGTNLPKIPGTSLAGAARSYAAMRYGKIQCAGQGGINQPHCGQPTCPICYTFGTVRGTAGGNAGTVSISDARLLLFPVHSLAGPVWVTSPSTLADFGIAGQRVSENKAGWNSALTQQNRLNLGWLMLEKDSDWSAPDGLQVPQEVKGRIVLVSDKLFSQIVNSNLEVRTSVSIDPRTGAATEGALFTYEALPRATWLWLDVVEDDYRRDFPTREKLAKWKQDLEQNSDEAEKLLKRWSLWKESDGEKQKEEARTKALKWIEDDLGHYNKAGSLPSPKQGWQKQTQNREKAKQEDPIQEGPIDVVRAGLQLAEYLGIGGMGTRGFGRIRITADWEV
jgi:CRISPR-associated protein Cmr4